MMIIVVNCDWGGVGIISILDEECLRPGETSDLTFLCKMDDMLMGHAHYLSHAKVDTKTRKSIQRYEFRLRHYAGEVTYSVHGFLEKNNDLLFRDLKESMTLSTNPITKDVIHSFVYTCSFSKLTIKVDTW